MWPLALLALAGLMDLILRAPDWKRAGQIGWLFGLGVFSVGNGWLAQAFTYQSAMPAWLGWVAVLLLAAYLAVYPALAVIGAWLLSRRNASALTMAFAGCWVITEWLRSWIFTGYPTNPLAAVALGPFTRPGLAAILPVMGTYALSGVVILLSGAWLIALRRGRPDWRGGILVLLPAALLLMPNLGADPGKTALRVTLIQPNIPQSELNDPAFYATNYRKLAKQTAPSAGERRLVLWPESGVPDYLRDGYPQNYYSLDPDAVRNGLATLIGAGGMLLTGTTDLELRDERVTGVRNVVTALDSRGVIRGSYNKAHLVPFGEYLPMRPLLTSLGMSRLVPGDIDFKSGPGPRTLSLGTWGRPGVQICYEIIFSGQVASRTDRPDFLFNPFNDGWYGATGPPQHLADARLRAIEEGLPVLRTTTTGISALIAANGVVLSSLPRNTAGRIEGFVPKPLPPTLFAQFGNVLALVWAMIFVALSLVVSLVASRRTER